MISPRHLEPFSTGREQQTPFLQMSFREIAEFGWGAKARVILGGGLLSIDQFEKFVDSPAQILEIY
jgi:hypothetical protein